MRPLRLHLEGFTCFKERQVLDFQPLDLFAITGPTGAGKTSLLDAMIFALYGRIPRVGRSYTELISLGRDRMSVVLEFQLLDRRFRIIRVGRRNGTPMAVLEEIHPNRERRIADGVREVDRAVQDLLGLPYEAFTQAVVLPQGEFATFLKSPPRERREILRNLLRLQVYERMRQLAEEERQALEGSRRGLERLCEEFADATPEALQAAEEEVARLRRERDEFARRLREAQRRLEAYAEDRRRTMELEALREQERALEAQEKEIRAARERLKRAERLHEVLPWLEAADRAEAEARVRSQEAEAARRALEQARSAYEEAQEGLARAEAEARRIPALRERIRALDELGGILEALDAARSRLKTYQERVADLETEVGKAQSEQESLESSIRRLEAEVEAAERALVAIGYEEAVDRLLEEASERAAELGRAREELAQALKEAEALEAEAQQARATSAQAEQALARARQVLTQAAQRAEAAASALQQARLHHAAHVLRAQLRPGDPCPVCAQPVARPPEEGRLPELAELEAQAQKAQEELERARQAADRAAADHARAQATAEQTERRAREAWARQTRLRRQVERWTEELVAQVGNVVAGEPGESIDQRIRSGLRRMREKRRAYAQAKEGLEERRRALVSAEERRRSVLDQVRRLSQQLREVRGRLMAEAADVERYEARIREVTDAQDPLAEREALAREIERMEAGLSRARSEEARAAAELAQARARAEELERASQRAWAEAQAQRARAEESARAFGFRDSAAVREAALSEAEQERLRALVENYEVERRTVRQRLRRLERELQGRTVTEEEVRRVQAEAEALEAAYREAVEGAAAAEQRLSQLRERVERAERLRAERVQLEAQYGLVRRLAEDLRSDRFQEFVLEEAFRELVAGASVRLFRLSHRYTLEYGEDGSFVVVDHDNAEERRSADTLSGGETFLAALSLALELSEQVQRASGAVALHSLFIDEGFGTLDPETLDHVACAIESLQTGGRMVGIITHLAELSARLPTRVVVEKRPEGSRIRVVTE